MRITEDSRCVQELQHTPSDLSLSLSLSPQEASAKRCTELAKEVWRLKSLVVDLQEHYTQDQ